MDGEDLFCAFDFLVGLKFTLGCKINQSETPTCLFPLGLRSHTPSPPVYSTVEESLRGPKKEDRGGRNSEKDRNPASCKL